MTDDIAQQASKDISEEKTEEAAPTGGQVKEVIEEPAPSSAPTPADKVEVAQPKEKVAEEIVESPSADAEALADKPAEEPKTKPEPKIIETPPPAPSPPKPTPTPAKTIRAPKLRPTIPPVPQNAGFMTQFLDKLKEFRGGANEKRSENVKKNLEKIMEFANRTQKVTNDDVERITGVKDAQAQRYLKKLVGDRKLVRFGKTSNIFYKPTK